MNTTIEILRFVRGGRLAGVAGALLFIAVLYGCGGGGGGDSVAGVGSGGTGAAASGPIRGFGSVIINSTRFDDRTARVTLDDDSTVRSDDLRLGMMVEIEGEVDRDGTTGRAASIVGRSWLRGPISAIDSAGSKLTVLGTQVSVLPDTVFDGGAAGLGALAVNDRVEVYGIYDGAGGVRATRIEKTVSTGLRLTGIVQGAGANAFRIGGVTVRFQPSVLSNLPNGVVNGALVRIKGDPTTPGSQTDITAGAVRGIVAAASTAEGKFAEVEGIITRFVSSTDFDVNGLPVSLGSAATLEGTLGLGARVEVEGKVVNGRVVAVKAEVKNEQQPKGDSTEVHSVIVSVDAANRSLTLRNGTVVVRWDASTDFKDIAVGGLQPGVLIEVKGRISGNALLATRIRPE